MNIIYKNFEIVANERIGFDEIPFKYYTVKGFDREFLSHQGAKVAITKRIALTDEIEVVPRTQQEIDDYGPNGIQPPTPKSRLLGNTDSYKLYHDIPLPQLKAPQSRNKREGGYCGRYKAGDKNFKMAHYRVGLSGLFETLKQTARFYKELLEA